MPAKSDSNRYFLSPSLDALLLGGGSIATFAALQWSGWDPKGLQMAIVALWLSWVVNWPHFSATVERLVRSPESRREFPLTVFFVPAVIVLAMAACFAAPANFAPAFIKLYLIWSPYHFSGQTVGVTLIYARRNEVALGKWGRRWLSALAFGTFVYAALDVEIFANGGGYYGISYPGFGVPTWAPTVALAVLVVCALGFLFSFAGAARGKGCHALMVLLPLAAQFTWFVLARKNLAFFALVPLFHSLQYLPVVWAMGMAERKSRGELSKQTFWRESGYWYGANLMGGIVLFHFLPRVIGYTGVRLELATGVVLAGVQIHHFFVDGVVWKLKSTRVCVALTQNLKNVVEAA